jgi:hypothetical protein
MHLILHELLRATFAPPEADIHWMTLLPGRRLAHFYNFDKAASYAIAGPVFARALAAGAD